MNLLRALQPFASSRRARGRGPGCELCDARLDTDHAHLADVERRALACACRGCALLFTNAGPAKVRWRTVPDRHLRDRAFALTDLEWEALGIPVSMAFFFKSSAAQAAPGYEPRRTEPAWTAVYPSPAGPIESLLRLEAWGAIGSRTPLADAAEPDVEALLVTAGGAFGYECMLVPIHACYALVGHVRRRWRGLDGGQEAREAIASHLGVLLDRCQTLAGGLP